MKFCYYKVKIFFNITIINIEGLPGRKFISMDISKKIYILWSVTGKKIRSPYFISANLL